MKNNLELILLVGNWVVVAIQAFTIFLYASLVTIINSSQYGIFLTTVS